MEPSPRGGASGGSPGGATHVRYRMSIRPALAPPPEFGRYSAPIFEAQVKGILQDLERYADRWRMASDTVASDGR